jgi:site-specific recombinase XerD
VALRVPLGKLHSERLVPVSGETQRVLARILELGAFTPVPEHESPAFLLPRCWQPVTWYKMLHNTLRDMARGAGCTGRVNPHRLRRSFATEMVRFGVSLPALMRMIGHRDIRMTLRYVEVVQLDLQREFHRAREKKASLYS